jgi:hypothetical protein
MKDLTLSLQQRQVLTARIKALFCTMQKPALKTNFAYNEMLWVGKWGKGQDNDELYKVIEIELKRKFIEGRIAELKELLNTNELVDISSNEASLSNHLRQKK